MLNPEYDSTCKGDPIARRVTPRIECFELLKGIRNFVAQTLLDHAENRFLAHVFERPARKRRCGPRTTLSSTLAHRFSQL